MNRAFFIIFLATSATLTSCYKRLDVEDYNGSAKIGMSIVGEDKTSFIIGGTGPFNINWGDGTIEKGKLVYRDNLQVNYQYNNDRPSRTITISGEIRNLEFYPYSRLTELDVNLSPLLIELIIKSNLITRLDVSNNTVLNYIDCSENQMNVDALNDLFESLHSNDVGQQKYIDISDNPGTNGCDRSIATNKGWVIY